LGNRAWNTRPQGGRHHTDDRMPQRIGLLFTLAIPQRRPGGAWTAVFAPIVPQD
jgi:hypothetical protein